MDFLSDLAWRGQIYQETDPEGLRAHLASGVRRAYCGFDPTASSLTIGNLVPLLMLARLQRAGHVPVVVFGGGTGLIGDPSGKDSERQLLSAAQIEANIAGQRPIFERILDLEGPRAALLADNAEWLGKLSWLEALRDVGKHFSVNMMIQKDSVRSRLESREHGISYTEFSYMLLQAYDFLWLHEHRGVTIELAGSDQWGNIVAGIDLIRRVRQAAAYGLTAPLVTRADGGKFGKTETGAIWLTADRTSPYALYQFWLNAADADVPGFLRTFTFLGEAEIAGLLADHAARPSERTAHRALARHVTELLHGASGLADAEAATAALFSGQVQGLSRQALADAFHGVPEAVLPRTSLAGDGLGAVELLVEAHVVKSKREARDLLAAGAISLNGQLLPADGRLKEEGLLHGELALLRRGKKSWHVARFPAG